MSKQPEAYIDFEVYEDSVNLVGVAKVTPPDGLPHWRRHYRHR